MVNGTLPHLVRGRPNRWRPFALNGRRSAGDRRIGGGDMRLSSWKTDGVAAALKIGGQKRRREGKEAKSGIHLPGRPRLRRTHSRGGINDLMGHHHESRAKSGDGNRNSAALSLFNRGKEGCCNGYPSCKGRCRDQTGCHLARKRQPDRVLKELGKVATLQSYR